MEREGKRVRGGRMKNRGGNGQIAKRELIEPDQGGMEECEDLPVDGACSAHPVLGLAVFSPTGQI
jgi:hypothetical protein